MRSAIFKALIKIAELIGTVARANMHSGDFMMVEGVTRDGREFYVSLNVKEGEKDA